MDGIAENLLANWLRSDDDVEILDVSTKVGYLTRKLFDDYEPSQYRKFPQRLDAWLSNVDEDHLRRTLYKLIGKIFFVGRAEFESLCRAAFHGPITRWLIDQVGIEFNDAHGYEKLSQAVENTWFCPVTDSMRINAFLKVNNIEGHKHRPDWRSLRQFGEPAKIKAFIERERIERLVLLEDFVGTGTQMSSAVNFAADLIKDFSVLCCPLIVCPDGVAKGAELARRHSNLLFEPILSLPGDSFIKFQPQAHDTPLYADVRSLTSEVAGRLHVTKGEDTHGFEGTGALVVLYSNCPNNTLPIIHDETSRWSPLFPRIRRR